MSRHRTFSIRKPEPTSSLRFTAFNKDTVSDFFDLLNKLYDKYNFPNTNVYNVDEAGVTCNPKSHAKVVSVMGKKQVGTRTSAERGKTVTTCICCSAAGVFMPPLLIFPRKTVNQLYLEGAPAGATAEFNGIGWMDEAVFCRWMKKFIEFSHASKENPVLLVLDNHSTHAKNVEAIQLAIDNGVVMLSLPPAKILADVTNQDIPMQQPIELQEIRMQQPFQMQEIHLPYEQVIYLDNNQVFNSNVITLRTN
ncbi:hypothetical protein TKK_0004742 [Trichogramma kaykai]